MKQIKTNRLLASENLFVPAFLFLYAVILLSSDPEWLIWAGPITLGAFPADIAPPLPFDPADALRGAAAGVMLGLLAFVVLLAANGSPRTHGERRTTAT